LRAALAAFSDGDLPQALSAMRAAIELLPQHAEYHAVHGFFLQQDQQQQPAQAAYQRALERNPLEMLANYGLGTRAYQAKDWQAAARYFHAAWAAQPKRPETQYYLAMVCYRLGDLAGAQRWMEAALARFHRQQDARYQHCQEWLCEFTEQQEKELL